MSGKSYLTRDHHRQIIAVHANQSKSAQESLPIEAAMRAAALLEKGDLDGYAVWERILRAVEELQGTVPKSGEAVH